MKIDDQENTVAYTTSDLGFAAALISLGYPFLTVDKSNPRRVLFCFSEIEDVEELNAQFWSLRLTVDACTLVASMKLLKGRIYGS